MSDDKEKFEPTIDPSGVTVQQMLGTILHERVQGGALEQAITKSVDKLISDAAEDVFRSYGDVGKAIKTSLSAAIAPTMESLGDLPRYHDYVATRIKESVQDFYDNRLAEALDRQIAEVMAEIPEKLDLEFIVEKLVSEANGEDEPEGEITLEIQASDICGDRFIHVYIDKEPDTSKHNCDYQMHLSRCDDDTGGYEIISITIDGEGTYEREKNTRGRSRFSRHYGIDNMLYSVFAMKGRIHLNSTDADDYETSWSVY